MSSENRLLLARGAALLFCTNRVAIVFAVIVVYATRFLRAPNVRATRTLLGIGLSIAALAAISVPLTSAYNRLATGTRNVETVHRAISRALAGTPAITLQRVTVNGDTVTIEISGPGQIPQPSRLEQALKPTLGSDVEVVIRRAP